MKRFTTLLLCFVLLLGGCSDGTPSEPYTSEQETQQATEQTSTALTTTAIKTTTATVTTTPSEESSVPMSEETAEALPKGYDYMVPERIEEKAQIKYIESTEVDITALRNEIGYELHGIDLESDEYYVKHRDFIRSKYSGEELESYRNSNYFEEDLHPRALYVGSEETDWVLIAEYNLQAQLGQYSRLACIKEGSITYLTDGLDIICDWWYSDGQLIASAYEKGLCIFDIDSRSIEYIDTDINGDRLCVSWLGIYYINEDYIIFENGDPEKYRYISTYIYDRRTGKAEPTTLKAFTDLDDRLEVIGDRLYYLNQRTNECGVYDLISHEYTETSPTEYPTEPAAKDENYTIRCIQNDDTQEACKAAVIITRHSDGAEKAFDLRKYVTHAYDWINGLYSDENWLYLSTRYSNIALNFETGQITDIEGGDLMYLYSSEEGYWSYRQSEERRSVVLAEIIPPQPAE